VVVHIPLTTKDAIMAASTAEASFQVQTVLLLMHINARGTNDIHLVMAARADAGTDRNHACSLSLSLMIKHARKRCQRLERHFAGCGGRVRLDFLGYLARSHDSMLASMLTCLRKLTTNTGRMNTIRRH
jgi:hypothetical protein